MRICYLGLHSSRTRFLASPESRRNTLTPTASVSPRNVTLLFPFPPNSFFLPTPSTHQPTIPYSKPPAKPKPPIHPRHSHILPKPRITKSAKPHVHTARHRLISRITTNSRRRLAPLVVEERIVAVGPAVYGPFGGFDPFAEVVVAFVGGALDV